MVACYYGRTDATCCRHKYSVGKRHLAGGLEISGFADNSGAKGINNGDKKRVVYIQKEQSAHTRQVDSFALRLRS